MPELLSMGRHRPLSTQMDRSLNKVREETSFILEDMYETCSTNLKDNLQHDITANVARMAKSQLISIIQSCSHEHIHSQGHYKPNIRKVDNKGLWSQEVDHYKLL